MPFTPYHFGPSGFIGLVFRRWIDVPVFVLANVIVDVEVLVIMILGLEWPIHRHCHTLLIGAVVGALWGVAAYPLRNLFERMMQVFRIHYKGRFWKMVISGILGVWLHVLIDGVYHFDVKVFWPHEAKPLWTTVQSRIGRDRIETICLVFLLAATIPYAIAVASYMKQHKIRRKTPAKTQV
jgi:membrane-bound metal-dependent hydrolase YbcI (DUF457 family)